MLTFAAVWMDLGSMVGARPRTSKESFILVQFSTGETMRSQPRWEDEVILHSWGFWRVHQTGLSSTCLSQPVAQSRVEQVSPGDTSWSAMHQGSEHTWTVYLSPCCGSFGVITLCPGWRHPSLWAQQAHSCHVSRQYVRVNLERRMSKLWGEIESRVSLYLN